MAQAWESPEIKQQGDLYNQAKKNNDKAGMAAARAKAEELRNNQGYQTDVSGLNATALNRPQPTNTPVQQQQYQPQQYQPQSQGDIASIISQELARQNQANQQQQNNMLAEIEKAKNNRIASRNAALGNVLAKTKSSLAAEKGTIAPQYQGLKNDASSSAQLRAKRISEIMAQKGYSEGYQGQSEIANNVAYRGNIGKLKTQEQAAYDDIARRGTDAESAYEAGIAQSLADNDTLASEQRLAQLGTERNYAREDLRNAISDSRYADETAYNRSQTALNRTDNVNEARGYVNPTAGVNVPDAIRQQLSQYANDYTAFSNSTPDPDLKYYSRVLANEKMFNDPELLARYGDIYKTSNQRQQDLTNTMAQQQFDYQRQRDNVADTQWQKAMNLNLRQQTFAEAQQKIENAFAQRRINQEGASQALQWAKFNADQDPNSLDNQYKKAQIDQMQNKVNSSTTNTVDDYASTINRLYTQTPNASNYYSATQDTSGIKAYLDSLLESGVDDAVIDQLAARYNIK